jgi:hypothetical protein
VKPGASNFGPMGERAIPPYRLAVYVASTLLAVACNYILGKDMAWDTLNYHLYLGFSALNDRFGQDYFAAGGLSYLNPYAYIPFYAMVRAGLPALAICSIFAVVHSIILWLTYQLAMMVCPAKDAFTRAIAGGCAIALAFMNPILMQQIGSCFADITTAELALAGWLILACAVRTPRTSRVIWAGLILGASSALKLSNMVAALAAVSMLIMLPLGWRSKIRLAAVYSAALCIGFVFVAAPWSYRLEREFGNPLFPMFNNIFRSPQFTTEPMVVYRFIPESIGDALWRPFAMINPVAMVHEELRAPDPRYAIIVVLGVLFVLRWAWVRFRRAPATPNNPPLQDSSRVLAALGLGLALYWTLWLLTSGNSRYVLAMACIAAAVIVGMLFQFFETRPKICSYILAIIFVTQAVQLYVAAEFRWNPVAWGGPWFDVDVPENLRAEPNLYLTLGAQSNSFIAPFLARGSAFSNFAGGYTLDPDGVNGAHLKALIGRFLPNVRVVFGGGTQYKNVAKQAPLVTEVDDALQRYGLRSNTGDCAAITVHGLPPLDLREKARDTTYLATCRVVPDTEDKSMLMARRREVDIVFDRLEDACPKLFRPRRLLSMHEGDIWRRLYGGTDISAWISHGRLKFVNLSRPSGITDLGSERDWSKAPLQLECGAHDGVSFVHLAGSKE